MNIIYFKGGLGNQMFQYALYKELESRGRIHNRVNTDWYLNETRGVRFELNKVFPNIHLKYDKKQAFEKRRSWYLKVRKDRDWIAYINYHIPQLCIYFNENEDGICDKRVFGLKNAAINGYWQTEKYFKHVVDILHRDFTFSYGEEKLQKWKERLLTDNNSVAIHIRRGDYLENANIFGNLSESMYYKKAIDFIKTKISHPNYIFFSNDIPWVKDNYFFENAVYIEKNMFDNYQSWYDMCLMSCCTHNIIANSSFSWWGSWLSDKNKKIVIAPREWIIGKKTSDIWCDNWVLI